MNFLKKFTIGVLVLVILVGCLSLLGFASAQAMAWFYGDPTITERFDNASQLMAILISAYGGVIAAVVIGLVCVFFYSLFTIVIGIGNSILGEDEEEDQHGSV